MTQLFARACDAFIPPLKWRKQKPQLSLEAG